LDILENSIAKNGKGSDTPSPAWYIPTLYFVEGLPYTMVNMMSVILLKNLNLDNALIGLYTSALSIPWFIKFLWAPLVDLMLTRRKWILVSHVILAFLTCALSLAVFGGVGVPSYLVLFGLIGFASATQDIAMDGYYMDALGQNEQAFYVGIRNTSYRVAWLFGSGTLVFAVGWWIEQAHDHLKGVLGGWAIAFAICSLIFIAATFWHSVILPKSERRALSLAENKGSSQLISKFNELVSRFPDVFASFLEQPRIAIVIVYILVYRAGDAFMLKMAQPFLLDPSAKGGLELSTAQVGMIYGTIGVLALLVGGLIGGWLISKYGLKRCIMPNTLAQNGAILLYWLMAILKPGVLVVSLVNALEYFAYGLGWSAFTVFLLTVVKPEYKAAHYAIATALMALGLLVPGAVSGYLVNFMGYQNFFLFSFLSSIPGIICILYLPIRELPKTS
jgi:MFS transporter, PAT family, beta-lactamase induction signal transducer AmpG